MEQNDGDSSVTHVASATRLSGDNRHPALSANHLMKGFRNKVVLRDITFALYAGEIVGLVGANGAGKTTLLGILAQMLSATSGDVSTAVEKPLLLEDRPAFATQLTLQETLMLALTLSGLSRDVFSVTASLTRAGLLEVAHKPVKILSMGQRQRLSWAHALLLKPKVVLLDEPSAFLDPPGVIALREVLRELRAHGTAILLSSHNLHEISLLADRVLLLADGVLVDRGDCRDISSAALEQSFFFVGDPS